MERLKVEQYILNEEVKEYRRKLFFDIKKNKQLLVYLESLGITDDAVINAYLSTISSYLEDKEICKNCPGFNNCNKRYPHYEINLKYNGHFLDKTLTPCKHKIEDDKKNEKYLVRDFPASWRNASLTSMDKSKVRVPVLKKYKEALDSKRNWIFITGVNRSGKSYIASALLNGFIDQYNEQSAFINYPMRIRDLQDLSYSNKEEFNKRIQMYSTVPLLVLDDFGNEYKNEYIRDTITLAILQERARLGLVTIFTSELNFEDIESMYSLNAAGKARGRQIRRLLETFAGEEIDVSTAAIY